MADNAFPPPVPPEPSNAASTPTGTIGAQPAAKKPLWKRWWAVTVAGVVLIAAISAITGGKKDEKTTDATNPTTEQTSTGDTSAGETSTPDTAAPPNTEPQQVATTVPATDPPVPSNEVAGAPAGIAGTLASPVPAGEIADLGDGWRLQVLGVVDDATTAIAAENQFNDPPPPGKRFTMVTVALGYYGLDDPQSTFTASVSAVGAAKSELSNDCGVIPFELTAFGEVFSGGVTVGNLCFVTDPADATTLALYAQVGFVGDEVFLDVKQPTKATPMAPVRGPQLGTASAAGRTNPTKLGTTVDIGEGWSMAVTGAARDITDAVLKENRFNDKPQAGFRFVGIDVTYAYNGAGSSNGLSVTLQAVSDSNLRLSEDCGVTPGQLDSFTDIFAGGSVSGTECFVVPEGDIGTIVATAYAGFDSSTRVYFAVK